jgi:E3 ubiquitin-protein ligase DOA10
MRLLGSSEVESDAVCWVCCDSETEDTLLPTGCACRGSGGFSHVKCLVDAATHDVARWTSCPTCLQDFTGIMEVRLAQARWDRVRNRSAEDAEVSYV